jgi:hypothetical protein
VTPPAASPPLRFCFEVVRLRVAADLIADLRAITQCPVCARPAARQLRDTQVWTVALETPSMPLAESVIPRWEETMEDIARRHPGCRFIGWKSLPAPPS